MLSVLQNASKHEINYHPFPHIVIENCLPETLYRNLEESYPEDDIFTRNGVGHNGENKRLVLDFQHVTDSNSDLRLSKIWTQWCEYHTSHSFVVDIFALMGSAILTTHPEIARQISSSSGFCRKPFFPVFAGLTVGGNIGINTVSSKTSSVRSVHTDDLSKFFAGVMYFRRPEDNTNGGDLELFEWRNNSKRLLKYNNVNTIDVNLVSTVKYRANTAVFWVNSDRSLHGVSPRAPSSVSRRLLYFSAGSTILRRNIVSKPIFNVATFIRNSIYRPR